MLYRIYKTTLPEARAFATPVQQRRRLTGCARKKALRGTVMIEGRRLRMM